MCSSSQIITQPVAICFIFTVLNLNYMRSILIFCVALCSFTAFAGGGKNITLEDLWKNGTFRVKDVPGFNAMKDGLHYTQKDADKEHQSISMYALEDGAKTSVLFDNKVDKYRDSTLSIDGYAFSADEHKLLLLAEGENIYRRSVLYRTYVFDIDTHKLELLDTAKVLHASFSPDGTKVAFVKNNNLFYKDLKTNNLVQVTSDGAANRISNGNCDWVYEEEFGFTKAYEWSEDGSELAYYRFDETPVPEYFMAKYTGLYPEQYAYKYPKAGENNSIIQIKIYNVNSRKTVGADLGSNTNVYVPRIKAINNTKEWCVYRLNRLQNKLELLSVDGATGKSSAFYTDTDQYYVNINDEVEFLPDGKSMIISNERAGYTHLWFYDRKTGNAIDLTPGNYDIDNLVGVDAGRKVVYYSSAEASPMQRNLYSVEFSGKKKKNLTPEAGYHSITPCKGYRFFLDRFSTINHVPVFYLRNADGKVIRTLEDNHDLEAKMRDYALGNIKMVTLKGQNDNLNGWMITPPDFDSTRKYPVLMYQYSGPASQEVADRFPLGNFFWHQMLAEKGYIIVCADGTGTGFRGEAFRKKTYLQLGKYESDDQIAVAKYLAKLPYVDDKRIGIWGWSYGGFMASTCILKGNDVFKTAIAVAPVTNWRYYDNIYTERYMRTPQENPKGYDENAPEKMADRLKGKFLFIHGTADDNVHFQNSVMLASAFIKAGKDYDSEYYPDKAHGISGLATRYHLYRRMTDFILQNL